MIRIIVTVGSLINLGSNLRLEMGQTSLSLRAKNQKLVARPQTTTWQNEGARFLFVPPMALLLLMMIIPYPCLHTFSVSVHFTNSLLGPNQLTHSFYHKNYNLQQFTPFISILLEARWS